MPWFIIYLWLVIGNMVDYLWLVMCVIIDYLQTLGAKGVAKVIVLHFRRCSDHLDQKILKLFYIALNCNSFIIFPPKIKHFKIFQSTLNNHFKKVFFHHFYHRHRTTLVNHFCWSSIAKSIMHCTFITNLTP